MAFCQTEKPLVTADPSYGSPAQTAQRQKYPVKPISLDGNLFLDLDKLVSRFVWRRPGVPLQSEQPVIDHPHAVGCRAGRSAHQEEVTGRPAILIDEAYIDYATAPGVGTAMKVALELPDVFVTRTFSKAYGMAGMRMGYAIGQPETLRKLNNAWGLGDIGELQAVAGIAALADQEHMAWEKQENKRVRDYTHRRVQEDGLSRSPIRRPTSSS